MKANIIEIKAKCVHSTRIHELLMAKNADFKGTDHQIDTYFKVPAGRLKLRQGNIENSLIFYNRPDQSAPKHSQVLYQPIAPQTDLETVLTAALPVLTVVDKQRRIYFIDNVKFHLDEVQSLGNFVEIEAIDQSGRHSLPELRQQCDFYLDYLGISSKDLIKSSYSDLLLHHS